MFRKVTRHSRSRSMREWRVGTGDIDVDAHGTPSTSGEPGCLEVSDPTLKDASWHSVHNAEIAFYRDRPLPSPPPPKPIASDMLNMPSARPSTSGGPNAKASAFLGFPTISPATDRKMSIDDMSLSKSTGSKKGLQPYKTGVTRGPGTASGASGAVLNTFSPPSAVKERILSSVTLGSADIPIGMALGSPAHPPETWETWQPRELPSSQPPLVVREVFEPSPEPPVQRQKTQRRKLFGGLFGSRKASESTGKSTREFSDSNASLSTATSRTRQGESTPSRSKTVADRKVPKHKPIIIRSNTFSQPSVDSFDHDWRSGRVAGGMDAPEKQGSTSGQTPAAREPLDFSSVAGPFLDVEIPNIKMERYSIMFGSVLDKSEPSSSSLLARRQATLERLKTINERIQNEEEEKERLRERRASSPQFAKSPGFALFPFLPSSSKQEPSPAALTPPRRPDARSRSYTSPANLPTPVKANFDLEVPKKQKKTVTIISPRTMERQNLASISRSKSQESIGESIASTVDGEFAAFHFGPDVSGLILESPKGLHSPDSSRRPSVADNQPTGKPTLPASEWQTIPGRIAASSPPSSTTASTHRSPSSSGSSASTHLTRPSLDIDESDTALKAAVEISIARQISISRQQRTLLRPQLRTTEIIAIAAPQMPSPSPNSKPAGKRLSPVEKVHISKTEGRVVETKSATPTLVVPRETLENYPAAHRKSERVVLEVGDY